MCKARRTMGGDLLEETLDIATANGTIDVWSMLIEAGTRTSLLKGIQSATTLNVSDFSDLLGQMNALRADQLMLLANHSMYNQRLMKLNEALSSYVWR